MTRFDGRQDAGSGGFALAVIALLAGQAVAGEFSGAIGLSAGIPKQAHNEILLAPGVSGQAMLGLSASAGVGLFGDCAFYRGKASSGDEARWAGTQWRVLALAEWLPEMGRIGERWHVLGQAGLGVGRHSYEAGGLDQASTGPAARLAVGLLRRGSGSLDVAWILSFDRTDVALDTLERKYPTLIALGVRLSIR